jgi:hypothetical protein
MKQCAVAQDLLSAHRLNCTQTRSPVYETGTKVHTDGSAG